MTISLDEALFYGGGECLERFGTLSWRTTGFEDQVHETHVRSSDGYFIDNQGILRRAGTDVPRVEWLDLDGDGVFESPSLLLEGARTNGWTRSEELDDAAWTKVNTTVSANATAAPDGLVTADKLIEDVTVANAHDFRRTWVAPTDNTIQVISVFAKAGERTEFQLSSTNKAGGGAGTWFDLVNGTIGTDSAALSKIEALANGWFRCSHNLNASSGGTTPQTQCFIGAGSETNLYNGDGVSGLFYWGMKL